MNKCIESQPYWVNCYDDVRNAVQIAKNTIYLFYWYEGVVLKHRLHDHTVEYIEANECGKTLLRNIGKR